MIKNRHVSVYRYTSRLRTRGNQSCKFRHKPLM